MNISLAPLSYCWDKQTVQDFYQAVADSKINTVYLGETVCSRRRELKFNDYLEIASTLKSKGKNVVLSTMALIEAQSELTELSRYIDNGEFMIEANDMAAVHLASQANIPFVCGPTINNYNRASLDILHKKGMQRFVMPFELSQQWLSKVIADKPDFEVEVYGHGYIPLAHSARCFTAKHYDLSKDNCKTICQQHPKGLLAQTQEKQPLLRLNGIQTQSAAKVNLIAQIPKMQQMGVDYWRLSVSSIDDITLANQIIRTQHQTTDLQQLAAQLSDSSECNGYWFGDAGMSQHS
ncbi:U32 family peptidase [Shewanella maritima]|uniref:U32 family peptidase n=1 Tax=Shewanella maritima TaxID=2520507 RepID=UPI00373651A3